MYFLVQVWTLCPHFLQKVHWRQLYGKLLLICAGLVISHFLGRFWDLVLTASEVYLPGPACGASDADIELLQGVLKAILALRI